MRTTPKMNLVSWDQLADTYNFAQLAGNWQILDFHDHSPGRGVPIPAGGLAPGAVLSGNIAANAVGGQHLAQTILQNLGLNQSGSTGRGAVSILNAQTTTSTAYTYLATPDVVNNVTLTSNGLIVVLYHALFSTNNASYAASADIFVGANELVSGSTGAVAPTSTTSTSLTAMGTYGSSLGLGSAMATDPTTGVATGSPTYIYAAAGTYSVGVQYKIANAAATLTAQNRHLWVWTVNFN